MARDEGAEAESDGRAWQLLLIPSEGRSGEFLKRLWLLCGGWIGGGE